MEVTKSIQLRFQYHRLDLASRHSKKKFRRKKRQQMVSVIQKTQRVDREKVGSRTATTLSA